MRIYRQICIVGVLCAEVSHASEIDLKAWQRPEHVHMEEAQGSLVPSTAAPISASGAYVADAYRVQLAAKVGPDGAPIAFRVTAFTFTSPQRMYTQFDTLPEVCRWLSGKLHLPQPQINAIARSLKRSEMTEIGGSRSGVTYVFQKARLRDAGLTFRPPE